MSIGPACGTPALDVAKSATACGEGNGWRLTCFGGSFDEAGGRIATGKPAKLTQGCPEEGTLR